VPENCELHLMAGQDAQALAEQVIEELVLRKIF